MNSPKFASDHTHTVAHENMHSYSHIATHTAIIRSKINTRSKNQSLACLRLLMLQSSENSKMTRMSTLQESCRYRMK